VTRPEIKKTARRPGGARILAVDLGASGGKCFAGSFEHGRFTLKELRRFSHEAVTFHAAHADGSLEERAVWDDVLLHSNVIAGLRTYGREVGPVLDSVGIDAWGADGAFVTEEGVPLGPMYAYRDHRLDSMIEQVKSRMDARRLYGITGIHFQPFNVSNQLLWWMLNRRGLVRKGVRFVPAPTLFSYWLGGVTDVDSSWASITQLMDCRTHAWSAEVLQALGIPEWIMPGILEPGTVTGRLHAPVAEAAGVSRAMLVAVASHDTASAFAAAPVSDVEGALILSSGTWSLIGKLIPEPNTGTEAMEANISNEGGIGNTRFLKNCMGMWIVQELRREWRNHDGREMGWDEISGLAMRAVPFAALIDPDDPSFYNPPSMERAISEYCRKNGQTAPTDRGALLRAVYECLALKYRVTAELISRISGRPNTAVHVVGGGSRNDFLNQMTADALGLPVTAGPVEATAVGNAMVQALGSGVISGMADALPMIRAAFPIRDFKPSNHGPWAAAYGKFKALLKV
jgi:rhamnulokinase